MFVRMLGGLEGEGPAERNGEHGRALLRLVEEPLKDGPQVGDLLAQAHGFGVAPRRVTAAPLFPVRDQELAFEMQQPLKLADLVQQRQARTGLNDQQRRASVAFGAEADALARVVDVEIDGSVSRHGLILRSSAIADWCGRTGPSRI